MAHEVISLDLGGAIGTEMHGFQGKSCLKAAQEIAAELERLGVVTEMSALTMKDSSTGCSVEERTTLKVEGQ